MWPVTGVSRGNWPTSLFSTQANPAGMLGSRRVRIGLALLVTVGVVGVGAVQLVPFVDRKATVASAETTSGTVTSAEYTRNQYSITYEYTVDGETYESDRVFPGPYAPGGTAGQQVLGQIPVYDDGETVMVQYAADDPSYAWLHTRESVVSRHVVYFFVTGLLGLVLLTYVYVELKLAGGSDGGPTHAAGLSMMTEMAEGYDPQDEATKQQMADHLPDEAVERARGPDGELDFSRLQRAAPAGGSSTGLLARLFALLRGVALVFGGGLIVLIATGFLLVSYLTP